MFSRHNCSVNCLNNAYEGSAPAMCSNNNNNNKNNNLYHENDLQLSLRHVSGSFVHFIICNDNNRS